LDKTLVALQAMETATLHDELCVPAKTLQMPRAPLVEPLAVEAAASTARAGLRPILGGRNKKFHHMLALIPNHSVSLDSYLTRWGHGSIVHHWSRVPNL